MGPSNNNSGMELAPPASEQLPATNPSQEVNNQSLEPEPLQSIEKMPNPNIGMQPPSQMPAAVPAPILPTLTQSDDSTTTHADNSLSSSDDNDLIDKEWVEKAKAIIENNRNDPYKQSEGLTNLKAEYMKKQFNKSIKLIK
jgi:hypothetical protein